MTSHVATLFNTILIREYKSQYQIVDCSMVEYKLSSCTVFCWALLFFRINLWPVLQVIANLV